MSEDTNIKSADVDLVKGRYLHIDKFCERTGKKASTVRKALNKGGLTGVRDGHEWFVDWIAYGEKLEDLARKAS